MIDQRTKHVVEEPVASTIISHRFPYAAWGAILAGASVVIAIQVLFALLGGGLRVVTINEPEGTLNALGMQAFLWWAVSGVIAFYAGGWVTGRLSGIPRMLDGIVHGVLAWSVTILVTILFLTTSVGMLISGGFGALKLAGQAVVNIVPSVTETVRETEQFADIQQEATRIFTSTAPAQDNSRVVNELMRSLATITVVPNPPITKQQIVDILLQNSELVENEARRTVDRWLQNIQMLKKNAQEKVEMAANTLSKAALASFMMLFISALAAGLGGARGAPHWSDQEII